MTDKQWHRMRLIGEAMRMKLEKVMTERQVLTESLTRALGEEQGASFHVRNRQALLVGCGLMETMRRFVVESHSKCTYGADRIALFYGKQVRSLIEELDANFFNERDIYCRAAWGIFWTLFKPIQVTEDAAFVCSIVVTPNWEATMIDPIKSVLLLLQKAKIILSAEGASPLDLVRYAKGWICLDTRGTAYNIILCNCNRVMEDLEAEFGPVEDPEGFRVRAMEEWSRIDMKLSDPAFQDMIMVNNVSS